MTPIEYIPEGLEQVVNGAWAEKRLKNRTAVAVCSEGDFKDQGMMLEVVDHARTHDANTTHTIIVSEDACRMGLIIQGTKLKGGE